MAVKLVPGWWCPTTWWPLLSSVSCQAGQRAAIAAWRHSRATSSAKSCITSQWASAAPASSECAGFWVDTGPSHCHVEGSAPSSKGAWGSGQSYHIPEAWYTEDSRGWDNRAAGLPVQCHAQSLGMFLRFSPTSCLPALSTWSHYPVGMWSKETCSQVLFWGYRGCW